MIATDEWLNNLAQQYELPQVVAQQILNRLHDEKVIAFRQGADAVQKVITDFVENDAPLTRQESRTKQSDHWADLNIK